MKDNKQNNRKNNSEESVKKLRNKGIASHKRSFAFLGLSLLLLIIDQATKYIVYFNAYLRSGETITVIPNFFQISYAFNRGAAFSFLSDQNWGIYVLASLSLLASLLFVVLLFLSRRFSFWYPLSLSFLLAGTLGNLLDRFILGGVIDFLDFYFRQWHFPTFNVADSCITIGAVILVCYILFVDDSNDSKLDDEVVEDKA